MAYGKYNPNTQYTQEHLSKIRNNMPHSIILNSMCDLYRQFFNLELFIGKPKNVDTISANCNDTSEKYHISVLPNKDGTINDDYNFDIYLDWRLLNNYLREKKKITLKENYLRLICLTKVFEGSKNNQMLNFINECFELITNERFNLVEGNTDEMTFWHIPVITNPRCGGMTDFGHGGLLSDNSSSFVDFVENRSDLHIMQPLWYDKDQLINNIKPEMYASLVDFFDEQLRIYGDGTQIDVGPNRSYIKINK